MNRKTLELSLPSLVACLGLLTAWARQDLVFAGIFAAQLAFTIAIGIYQSRL
jgi:hypothetical protein